MTRLVLWEAERAQPVVARIAITGDFLPAGALAFPQACGWRDMAQRIAPHFTDVDASFANLECALNSEDLSARPLAGIGTIVSAPVLSLDYLEAVRAQIAGIANNHVHDFGGAGVACTRAALEKIGMIPLGAGYTLRAAPEVFVWEGPSRIRVGFWAGAKACTDLATWRSTGVEPATSVRASRALREMKSRGAQFSIALLHAGCLRTSRPDPADVRLMDAISRCGFQVVAASHSHRIAGARFFAAGRERPSFCFYGLGSLVSGYATCELEREGVVVIAGLDAQGRLARVEVRPVALGETGFGEIPSPEAARTILDRFRSLSNEIADGSYVRNFYRDVSNGLVRLHLRDARAAFRHDGVRGLMRKAGRLRLRHLRRLAHRVIA